MAPLPDAFQLYIFLSYASADRERALQIADLLEGRGISVWRSGIIRIRRRRTAGIRIS